MKRNARKKKWVSTPFNQVEIQSRTLAEKELLVAIVTFIQRQGWSFEEAQVRCRLRSPRMHDLMARRTLKFSLKRLALIANRIQLVSPTVSSDLVGSHASPPAS